MSVISDLATLWQHCLMRWDRSNSLYLFSVMLSVLKDVFWVMDIIEGSSHNYNIFNRWFVLILIFCFPTAERVTQLSSFLMSRRLHPTLEDYLSHWWTSSDGFCFLCRIHHELFVPHYLSTITPPAPFLALLKIEHALRVIQGVIPLPSPGDVPILIV